MPTLTPHPKTIAAATAIGGSRTKFSIAGVDGLILECSAKGERAWFVRYQIGRGRSDRRRRYHRLGSFNEKAPDHLTFGQAKDRAADMRSAARKGLDSFAAERPSVHALAPVNVGSFEALFKDWLTLHAKPKKKSWQADEAMWNRHLKSRLAPLIAVDIRRAQLATIFDDIAVAATPTQADKAKALLSAVYSWAVSRGRFEINPCHKLPSAAKKVERSRILSDEEIRAFWTALHKAPRKARVERALMIALVTGQRRSEIALSIKTDLDLHAEVPVWTIPRETAKNGLSHVVPLSSLATQLFQEACAASLTRSIFPARPVTDSDAIDPMSMTRAMRRIGEALGAKDWPTVHDMRRTVGTGLAKMGVPKDVRAKVLNHVERRRSVTDIYDIHDYRTEKHRALRLWSLRLRSIILGRPRTLKW